MRERVGLFTGPTGACKTSCAQTWAQGREAVLVVSRLPGGVLPEVPQRSGSLVDLVGGRLCTGRAGSGALKVVEAAHFGGDG